jgi:hypothetical protein
MLRISKSLVLASICALALAGCGQNGGGSSAPLRELQRVKSGDLDVVLLTADDGLTHGKDSFVLEFRAQSGGQLRDVGVVKANATMPMAGMPPMFGTLELRQETPGRYLVDTDMSMAGTWQINVEWQGPAGSGSATLRPAVQ